ncbi:MAG: leucine-rich repeat domain-containing protein [Bacteroidota bacterium]
MKPFLFSLFLICTLCCFAQCDAVTSLLRKGDRFLQQSSPNYQEAINAYTAAIIACPERAQEGQRRIANMVNGINELRVNAVKAQAGAASALEQVKLAQGESQLALNKANKLVDAFYFYEGRFALAYGDNRQYYFIDKKGESVDKLGRWDKAEQFDVQGFAKVHKRNDPQAYLLDTFGRYYPVAYDLADLNPMITALDLDGQDLTKLPDSLWSQTQLEVLLLDGNSIRELPEDVSKLQQLRILFLSGNQLRSLPNSIGQLKNLRELHLRVNLLRSLPESITELENLSTLNLYRNSLKELPKSFGQLRHLKKLDLTLNSLDSLPKSFEQLQELEQLVMMNNTLSSLPENMGQLKRLTTLNLLNNSIATLPENFGQLEFLSNLNLANNSLIALPENFGELRRLSTLKLSNNSISILPENFGQLENLSVLSLHNNWLNTIPKSITQLEGLTELDLAENSMTSLPENIGQLQNLRILRISGNGLRTLPKSIAQLKGIDYFHFGRNPIDWLPAEVLQSQIVNFNVVTGFLEECAEKQNWKFAQHIRENISNYPLEPRDLFDLSWLLVNCQDYEGAIWAGEAYVAGGGTEAGALSNLAIGYLYSGQEENAIAIYEPHLERTDGTDQTGREIFLQDLNGTSHLEVKNPEAVARVRAWLEEQE